MKIAIGADHAGFVLKQRLRAKLETEGHEVKDFGADGLESTDYPDYAEPVARAVAGGDADRGILICSTGIGMSIVANKVPGIRAALGTNPEEVRLIRGHNDANILTLGANFIAEADAAELVNIFLATEFEGGRHARRLDKIARLENNHSFGAKQG
jgi:ribose 5-phosphate isomerase B